MTKRHVQFIIYLILFAVHFFIGFSYFEYLGHGSEVAGTLIRFGKKVYMIFLAAAYPLAIVFIYGLIGGDITKLTVRALIPVVLSVISIYIYNLQCDNTIKPAGMMSSEHYLSQQTREISLLRAQVHDILSNAVVSQPADSVKKKDEATLVNIVRKELDNFHSPKIKEPGHEFLLERINALISRNYSSAEKDSVIEVWKNTMQTDYILYGPGCYSFLAVLTFEMSGEPAEKYGHVTLLSHRVGRKLYAYSFTAYNSGGYGTGPTREGAMLKALMAAFHFGFGDMLLKLKADEIPPRTKFWTSQGLRRLFGFKSDTLYHYKYTYNQDSLEMIFPVYVYQN